jgi:hypothetical protein
MALRAEWVKKRKRVSRRLARVREEKEEGERERRKRKGKRKI